MRETMIASPVEIARLRRELARLERDSEKAMIARSNLPPGSSRARVTTANARWSQCAEARERVRARIEQLERQLAEGAP